MVIENLAKVKRKTLPEVQANLLLANLREGYQILKASSSVTMCSRGSQRRLDASKVHKIAQNCADVGDSVLLRAVCTKLQMSCFTCREECKPEEDKSSDAFTK
jgi:hypothetical protein